MWCLVKKTLFTKYNSRTIYDSFIIQCFVLKYLDLNKLYHFMNKIDHVDMYEIQATDFNS